MNSSSFGRLGIPRLMPIPVEGPDLDRGSVLHNLVGEYMHRTPESAAAHRRATAVMPGGETRCITYYAPYPLSVAKGLGAELTDIDGHRYIDLVNNYTTLVHGNAYAPAAAAAAQALVDGAVFPSTHRSQVHLAELLVKRVESVEQVRFTNSGTEASLLAARLVRYATGRTRLLVFDGGYHGSVPLGGTNDVVTVPYNDLDAVREALCAGDIAAVFAEPFLGAGGVVPGRPGFLSEVAGLARSNGALFVLDEVQSLRNSVGGEQGRLGLHPDLTLMGKIIGGGMPLGAVGGTTRLMKLTAADRSGFLRHSGTFNGHLSAAAAGAATLNHLDSGVIDVLNVKAEFLANTIGNIASDAGLPMAVTRAGSILQVHTTATEVPTTAEHVRGTAGPLQDALHLALLLEGVYTTPRGMINLSTALTTDHLTSVLAAYTRAFQLLAHDLRNAA
ncbi:aminotransferase class III-fold pyridoxal phosphate-dependent enzyme [Streptomyces sp. AV19]|uniref:aspartate aminotransferase family protein n=1 Tax=Streptomyces sp. AV19 TaxID=2793068 RepID=UPI0018FE5F87|nr:aminotransferase class III-fold pyridoxal phosphate-dependent enzyme [Streptomyces sp. AV19]MBH1938984.1 aminotransferase class III-fold pyridoxal phosphate-dependent enzyme [Streptomyces sp. AV19]MDG4536863.1 aminotransferase class III-fold pyridoxal phosphate-dependent enzyme [Streptomyces sp. AV19]